MGRNRRGVYVSRCDGLKKQLLWDGCNSAHYKKDKFSGTGDEFRDWLHIDDAVRLVQIAVDKASTDCLIVNGGTGLSTKIKDIVKLIFHSYGSSVIPKFEGIRRIGDPQGYQANIELARYWGWTPEKDLRNEIINYVKWYQSEIK